MLEPMMTTGEVARVMGVSVRTVTKWMLKGDLRGFTTPGGHRRIERKYVRGLMKKLGVSEERLLEV